MLRKSQRSFRANIGKHVKNDLQNFIKRVLACMKLGYKAICYKNWTTIIEYMVMYRYLWQCMAMYGYVWLCMAMYGYVWLCMAMYGYVSLCMAMYGYVWLCMAMYGCVWLWMYGYGCMAMDVCMHDYVSLCTYEFF